MSVSLEQDRPALDDAGRFGQQAHDGKGGDALAAAGLAHDAQGFPLCDLKLTSSTARTLSGLGVKGRGQVLDPQDDRAVDRCFQCRHLYVPLHRMPPVDPTQGVHLVRFRR